MSGEPSCALSLHRLFAALRPAPDVFTKDEKEVQLHGEGPFAITYFNPADDPRGAKSER
jgi:hypothetical protein